MVQLVEYITKNEKQIYKFCRKYTKNNDLAWDLLQTVYLRALELPDREILSITSYVYTMIRFNHLNSMKTFNAKLLLKSTLYKESCDDTDEYIENTFKHKQDTSLVLDYNPVETTIDTKKVLEIMNKICQPSEKQAIIHNLETDDARSNAFGKSFETLKASRRNAIYKIKNYLGE